MFRKMREREKTDDVSIDRKTLKWIFKKQDRRHGLDWTGLDWTGLNCFRFGTGGRVF